MDYPLVMDSAQAMAPLRTMDFLQVMDFPSAMDNLSRHHLRSTKVLLRKHR